MQSISYAYTMKKLITLPTRLENDVGILRKEFGFASDSEFIREAIRDKILELKKLLFFQISAKVSKGLKKHKVSEKDILREFREWKKK